jgi:hypothetical protein
MALAASAWVTTEQELKFAVLAAVVVGAGDVDDGDAEGLVVVAALVVVGGEEGDELHAAKSVATGTATAIPMNLRRSFGCTFIRLPWAGGAGLVAARFRRVD